MPLGVAPYIVAGEPAPGAEFSGQQSHAERAAVEPGQIERIAQGEHLQVAIEHAQRLLKRATLRSAREIAKRVRAVGAPAIGADLPLGHEPLEQLTGLQRTFDGQLPNVQQVHVDVVGAEPSKAQQPMPIGLTSMPDLPSLREAV